MLNTKQSEVVSHSSGALVNIAGPGSGKTHTLIEKIKTITEGQGASALREILVLTFTNSAAVEIRDRALRNFKQKIPYDLYFGTYHSTFKRLLIETGTFLNLGLGTTPTLSMPNETKRNLNNLFKNEFEESFNGIVERVLKEQNAKVLNNTLFKNHLFDTGNLLNAIEDITNKMTSSDLDNLQTVEDLYERLLEMTLKRVYEELDKSIESPISITDKSIFGHMLIDRMEDQFIYRGFKLFLKKHLNAFFQEKIDQKLITFSDIILITLFALKHRFEFKAAIRTQFRHVFIDEFQDTNIIQNEILKEINNNNICVIGDPYQSIYGFIGADIQNILNASSDYNANVIQLEENYRSTPNIVEFTNHLAQNMEEKVGGWRPNKSSSGLANEPIKIAQDLDKDDQRKYIVDVIKKTPKDKTICVINRNGNDFLTEKYFATNRLKFKKLGGLSLKESVEVQAFTTLFTYMLNTEKINALGYFLSRVEGIGEKSVETYIMNLKSDKTQNQKKKTPKKIADFLTMLDRTGLMGVKPVDNDEVRKTTEKAEEIYFKHIFPKISKTWKDDRKRLGRQKVKVIIDEILDQRNHTEALRTLDDYYMDNTEKKEEIESNLTLSTIHSAKGMEWDTVLLVDWHPGNFKRDGYPEAQRLNYVAVSRAKQSLHILSENSIFELSNGTISEKSEIFEEINTNLVKSKPSGVMSFGKHKGQPFESVPKSYLRWLMENAGDFFARKMLSQEDISLIQKILFR